MQLTVTLNVVLQVYVLQPKKMDFIPSVVEAQIGSSLSLPLAVASCIYTGTETVMNSLLSGCTVKPKNLDALNFGQKLE